MMPRREARGWVAFARCSCRSAHRSRTDIAHSVGSANTPRSSRLRFISLLGDARYQSTGFGWALPERVDRESDPRAQTVPISLEKIGCDCGRKHEDVAAPILCRRYPALE